MSLEDACLSGNWRKVYDMILHGTWLQPSINEIVSLAVAGNNLDVLDCVMSVVLMAELIEKEKGGVRLPPSRKLSRRTFENMSFRGYYPQQIAVIRNHVDTLVFLMDNSKSREHILQVDCARTLGLSPFEICKRTGVSRSHILGIMKRGLARCPQPSCGENKRIQDWGLSLAPEKRPGFDKPLSTMCSFSFSFPNQCCLLP